MARTLTTFDLPAAEQAALENFTRTGCRPVRAVRRTQALLALATSIGRQAARKAVGLSRQATRPSASSAAATNKLAGKLARRRAAALNTSSYVRRLLGKDPAGFGWRP